LPHLHLSWAIGGHNHFSNLPRKKAIKIFWTNFNLLTSKIKNVKIKLTTCISVNGSWSEWSTWSPCPAVCGNATTTRSRNCSEPKYGGEICLGNSTEIEKCQIPICPSMKLLNDQNLIRDCSICYL
jgi:hypothetical protein